MKFLIIAVAILFLTSCDNPLKKDCDCDYENFVQREDWIIWRTDTIRDTIYLNERITK